MTLAWLFTAGLMLWLGTIAIMDMRTRKVRNWMVVLGLASGLAALFSGVQPFWVTPWSGLLGMLMAGGALLPFYALRWMGAGDVKFAAVMGLWLGIAPQLLLIWLGGSVLAGVHGLLALRSRTPPSADTDPHQSNQAGQAAMALCGAAPVPARHRIRRSIPYAGYMALVAAVVVWRAGPALAT